MRQGKKEQKKQDKEKGEAGVRIFEAALKRKRSKKTIAIDGGDDDDYDDSKQSTRKIQRVKTNEDEREALGVQMKEAKMARVALDKKRLDVDRDRFNLECVERQKERDE